MINKTQELIDILKSNPDRKLIFLYPDEGSDYPYTLGYPTKILIDEYTTIDERVWLRFENEDELFDEIADEVFEELYPDVQCADDKQAANIDAITKSRIDQLNWIEAIVVYICY